MTSVERATVFNALKNTILDCTTEGKISTQFREVHKGKSGNVISAGRDVYVQDAIRM